MAPTSLNRGRTCWPQCTPRSRVLSCNAQLRDALSGKYKTPSKGLKSVSEPLFRSANTEEAVALHCVGLKSNRPCKDKALYRELLYDHADESDDDEDVWSVFSGKVERAFEFKAEMLKAFAPFRRLSPVTFTPFKIHLPDPL